MSGPAHTFRFGEFELDVAAYSLRRQGAAIVGRLWGNGVFVDAEMGINTAIRKVRQVLGGGPEAPTFIETVSGRGYRFVADVEIASAPQPIGSTTSTLAVLPFETLGAGE